MLKTLALAVLLAACHSSSSPASGPSAATPTPAPAPAPATTQAAPALHEKCGDNDACAPPATCVSYTGIAGARGPTFKTCEVKCTDDSVCPEGTKCGVIADGPGQVCH